MRKQKADTQAVNLLPVVVGPGDHNWYMWLDAFEDIDQFIEKAPCGPKKKAEAIASLCDLLRDRQVDLGIDVRECLADIFERVGLHRQRGRPKTPVYAISEAEHRWSYASNLVSAHMERGDPEEVALDKAAKKIGRNKEQLRSVLFEGKHGSFNRAKKR